MVMQKTCDAGDNNPGAYLITDLSNGDTAIWCAGHWIDLCVQVTRAAENDLTQSGAAPVQPQQIDPVTPDTEIPPVDPVDVAEISTVDNEGREVIWPHHPDDDAAAHKARVHAELAARPDSAGTSEAVVGWPGDES